jgi:glyoxylase-like metal-dependent hydrolase (beta-lactamase superfamily II)
LDGPDAAETALTSLHRMTDLRPRVLLPAHGPIPSDASAALAAARRRAQRLIDDPENAVWYGARRIFAFALMIYDGIAVNAVESYLHKRLWLVDAARLLRTTPEAFAAELIEAMLASSAVVCRNGLLYAAAEYTPVEMLPVGVPFPRSWPS